MRLLFVFLYSLSLQLTYSQNVRHDLDHFTPAALLKVFVQIEGNNDINTTRLVVRVTDPTALPEDIGKVIDEFITPRPWWYVEKEPYSWDSKRYLDIIFRRVAPTFEPLLKQYASVQFPSDCSQAPLRISLTGGFDSFGNNFYNYNVLHSMRKWSVIVPYIIDPESTGTSFLSKGSCPKLDNKFECAFLPPTTCELPPLETIERNQSFESATKHATPLTDTQFEQLHQKINLEKSNNAINNLPSSTYLKYTDIFSPSGPRTSQESINNYAAMFTYGILFRPNYSFRSQIFHEIFQFKSSLETPFPTGNCVAVHIRRNKDRAPIQLRGERIIEWCKVHKTRDDGTCFDDETQLFINKGDCIHSYDYGCHTANPYGALTLENYIHASDTISTSIKNIFLRTDDDLYVQEELKNYHGDKKIFYFPAHHNHRTGSTSSGISYLAAMELAKECNGFVGHSGSAVTNLFMSNLCIRHYGAFGTCPPFFDFGT